MDLLDCLGLLLGELTFLLVEVLCLPDDVVFLLGEFLVDHAFLALFLQETHGLEGSLGLDDEGAHFFEVLVADLGLAVLGHGLGDAAEELLDLALLVDIHF